MRGIWVLIGLAILAAVLTCGTWVMQEETVLRHGVEYAVVHWRWQWYAREAVFRALGLVGGAGLLVIAGIAIGRHRAAAPSAGRSSTAMEQRRSPRLTCDWPVRYQVRSLPFERQAVCVNISEGGMQCLMQERWVRHTPLELRIYPPAGAPIAFSGVVVWAQAAAERGTAAGEPPRHRIGIRFAAPAAQHMAAIVRLLAAGAAAPART